MNAVQLTRRRAVQQIFGVVGAKVAIPAAPLIGSAVLRLVREDMLGALGETALIGIDMVMIEEALPHGLSGARMATMTVIGGGDATVANTVTRVLQQLQCAVSVDRSSAVRLAMIVVAGSPASLKLSTIRAAGRAANRLLQQDCDVLHGAYHDIGMVDVVRVTVIAA